MVFLDALNKIVDSVNTTDVASTPDAAYLDSMTVADWARKTFPDRPSLVDISGMYVAAVNGSDPEQASILYFAHYAACAGGLASVSGDEKDTAQYQRMVDGE